MLVALQTILLYTAVSLEVWIRAWRTDTSRSRHTRYMFGCKLMIANKYLCKCKSVTKLQTAAARVGEYQDWNPGSWSTRNSLEKCIDVHKLHVTLTDASRYLHGTFT